MRKISLYVGYLSVALFFAALGKVVKKMTKKLPVLKHMP
jgi:hypothetical protein